MWFAEAFVITRLASTRNFPSIEDLKDLGIESYLGVPLLDGEGNVLGHLAVYDERPMPSEPRKLFIFRIFAARAAVELERLRVEQRLVESERRYRDLYEEAPNAYVAFGKDLRLTSVNRRAAQLLDYPTDELVGSSILGYFADSTVGPDTSPTSVRGVFRRGGDFRTGAGDEPAGREPRLGKRLDPADARRGRKARGGTFDLG